jgi:hypothetical protein
MTRNVPPYGQSEGINQKEEGQGIYCITQGFFQTCIGLKYIKEMEEK